MIFTSNRNTLDARCLLSRPETVLAELYSLDCFDIGYDMILYRIYATINIVNQTDIEKSQIDLKKS